MNTFVLQREEKRRKLASMRENKQSSGTNTGEVKKKPSCLGVCAFL